MRAVQCHFFISLKITVAVVGIEIKHLKIYLNCPRQATFIYVNNPSPVPCPGRWVQLLKVGGIPFGYYLHSQIREEKGKPGSSTGKCKGLKDHGQFPSPAVSSIFPGLACSKVYASNLILPPAPLRSGANRRPLSCCCRRASGG